MSGCGFSADQLHEDQKQLFSCNLTDGKSLEERKTMTDDHSTLKHPSCAHLCESVRGYACGYSVRQVEAEWKSALESKTMLGCGCFRTAFVIHSCDDMS